MRSWWLGLSDDGTRLFLQAPPDADVAVEQRALGGHGWESVTPLEFYRTLVDYLKASPDREEAYLEAMEETLEQWERVASE